MSHIRNILNFAEEVSPQALLFSRRQIGYGWFPILRRISIHDANPNYSHIPHPRHNPNITLAILTLTPTLAITNPIHNPKTNA